MLIAASKTKAGRRLLILGLQTENMERLRNDQPIYKSFSAEEVPGLKEWDVTILGPEDTVRFVAEFGLGGLPRPDEREGLRRDDLAMLNAWLVGADFPMAPIARRLVAEVGELREALEQNEVDARWIVGQWQRLRDDGVNEVAKAIVNRCRAARGRG